MAFFEAYGYTSTDDVYLDRFKHRVYTVLTPCGHKWTAPFTNIVKQVNNSNRRGIRLPCGVCGPKHRIKNAMDAFVTKYKRDYDLEKYEDYRLKVRRLSEATYNEHYALLNPDELLRGKKDYHLDHIIPIIECFKTGLTPEEASSVNNLQMLYHSANLAKGAKVS